MNDRLSTMDTRYVCLRGMQLILLRKAFPLGESTQRLRWGIEGTAPSIRDRARKSCLGVHRCAKPTFHSLQMKCWGAASQKCLLHLPPAAQALSTLFCLASSAPSPWEKALAGGNSQSGGQPVNEPLHHTGCCAVYDHRACDGEHFGPASCDKALCLCQVRPKFFTGFSDVEKLFGE